MFYYLADLALVCFEIFCCKLFFETFCSKQEQKKKRWYLIIILVFCIYVYAYSEFLIAHFILKQLVIILTVAIIMYFYFPDMEMKRIFLYSVLYQGLLLGADYLVYAINNTLFTSDAVIANNYYVEGMLLVIFGKAILFVFVLIIRKQFGDRYSWNLSNSEWIRFLVFPIFSILTITAMIMNFKYVENQAQENVLFIVAFGMLEMNLFVFYLLKDILQRKTDAHEKLILETQVKTKGEMYRSLAKSYESQKRRAHEFNNQILCIESLIDEKEYNELEKYIKNVSGQIRKEGRLINVNHTIINAILNTKYKEALEKDIVFVLKANDLHNVKIQNDDLIIILSNLLNNAIEACEKCESDKRVIKVKIKNEEEEFVISVRNSYVQPIVKDSYGIKTSKTEKPEEHGIGIKNIIRTIRKYNGIHTIKHNNKEFFFSILFPNK